MPELKSKPYLDMVVPIAFADIASILGVPNKEADETLVELVECLDHCFRYLVEASTSEILPIATTFELNKIDLESARTLWEIYSIPTLELNFTHRDDNGIEIAGEFGFEDKKIAYLGLRLPREFDVRTLEKKQ